MKTFLLCALAFAGAFVSSAAEKPSAPAPRPVTVV